MNRIKMMFLALVLVVASGCSKPAPQQSAALIRQGGSIGVYVGLNEYGKKKPADARLAAASVASIVNQAVLPYLDGATGVSSDVVDAVLQNHFTGLDPQIKGAIALAAGALDAYLPPPAPGTYLQAEHVLYLRAFCSGLADGSGAYLEHHAPAGAKAAVPLKPGAWLRL